LFSESTEKSLLASVIMKPNNIDLVQKWIEKPSVFYNDFHRNIWKTILSLNDKKEDIDIVSVVHNYPQKKYVGNQLSYEITAIATSEATSSRAEYYAKMLHGYWLRRELGDYSKKLGGLTEDNSNDISDLLNESHTLIGNLIKLQPTKEFNMDDLLEETRESIFNRKTNIKTGISKFDKVISGMTRGEITIIAGRPANGKTTVAANIARNLVMSGYRVAMFNREMPNTEMMKKFIAMEGDNISYRNLRHGIPSSKTKVHEAMDFIHDNYKDKLYMYDDIRTLADSFHEIKNIKPDVVIDDHIGLIEYPSNDRRDLRHKIGDTTKQYKWLAKAENMCVLLVSQLNRNIEYRTDSVPRLSDLAESGNLEQDAEIVAFTHYPYISRYGEEDTDGRIWTENEMQLVVSKNRYGTTGSVEVGYAGDSCKLFEDLQSAISHEEKKKQFEMEIIG
jgi:replicative DNA helicase